MTKIVLLTYPKSGSTWTRYILECLSGRPTDSRSFEVASSAGFEVSGEPVVYHRFWMDDDVAFDRMVLLVRNFRDAIVSLNMYRTHNVAKRYVRNLLFYDACEKPKLLVYYEDLMVEPEREIRRLCEFVDVDTSGVDEFMRDLDAHREICFHKCHRPAIIRTWGDLSVPVYDREGRFDMPQVEKHVRLLLGPEVFGDLLGRYEQVDTGAGNEYIEVKQ